MISIFFFSSRRRHTRSKRDWSSDVCSSDLAARELDNGEIHSKDLVNAINKKSNNAKYIATFSEVESYLFNKVKPGDTIIRSEERRVGKEYKYRLESYESENENCNDNNIEYRCSK